MNWATMNFELRTTALYTGGKMGIVNCVHALGAHRRRTVNCATVNCELRTGAWCTEEADNAL